MIPEFPTAPPGQISAGCERHLFAVPCKIFSAEEMQAIEAAADEVQTKAMEGRLPQTCFHESRGRGGNLRRTKFFFGARCMPHYASSRAVLEQ